MSIRRIAFYLSLAFVVLALAGIQFRSQLSGQNGTQLGLVAGRNVNMVSGTTWPGGDPYLQRQNEPSIAVSTRNPLHLLAGANDYRTIDIPFADEIPNEDAPNYVKDAWLGKFTSIDGGQTWKSTLVHGYPQDTSIEGTKSPIYGLGAASDPVVRSGPNGIFYYAGMAFDRLNRPSGVMFISRYIDNNYKENVDTIDYIDTKIIARGTAGQFIDKPWIAVDLPTDGSTIDFPAPGSTTQKVARHNVYAAYTVFLGTAKFTTATKILFSRSTDNGATWSTPLKLTESQVINQGATIALDPRGNGTIYVAWRRFGFPSQKDAIVVVKSKDRGKTFTKPVVVYEFAASTIQQPSKDGTFDQPTTSDSFRTNDYPTMAVDNWGHVFIVWSQRGFGPTSTAPALGESRLMISASYDGGFTWSAPPTEAVNAQGWDDYRPGHQFMPSLTYAAGKLTLLWYDQRWDLCATFEDPFIRDLYAQRHTIDVRVSQLPVDSNLSSLVFLNSIQVSRYPFVLIPDDLENPTSWTAFQLLYNMPNLPMFELGSVPFMGDYIDIAASPQYILNGATWVYNTNPNTPTVYHAVWTDNRDVLPAGEDYGGGDLSSGNFPLYNAPGSSCTDGSKTGLLNQNIYTSRISKGVIAGSPGNSKPLNFLRSFVVFVKNTTGTERQFDLQIMTDGAFFYDPGYPGVKPTLAQVVAYPYSYAQKTVLVESRMDEHAPIKVNVSEGGNLISVITLNPDPTNPPIDESEGVDPGNPRIRNDGETHTPRIRNYTIVDWNYEEGADPNITTVYPASYEDNANTDGVTPYPVGGDEQTPRIRNGQIRNPRIRNPRIRNNILNPRIRNESFGDNGVIPNDSHLTDIYWTIDNAGNTTSSFDLQTFETPTDIPDGVMVQVIIFKTYGTPTAEGCMLVEEEHQEVILNYEAPRIRNVSLLPEMTVDLKPNEKCHVLYRFYNPCDTQDQTDYYEDHEALLADVVPDITPDVPPTDPDNPDVLDPGGPEEPVGELLILPQILPDGVINQSYAPTPTLQAQGGTAPYAWSGTLPNGLHVDSSSGQILGEPAVPAGTYSFDVMVHDSAIDPNTATRAFTIRVSETLTITTTTLPFGILSTSYSASVEASGGFTPYAWSVSTGTLPPGLSLDSDTGVISGTPTSTGTYSFTIRVEDSTLPVAQSYTSDLAIEITLGGGGGDLVAHYLFNGNADDQSGNGNNGTVTAATLTEDRFGNADSAYSFNGSTSGIVIPNSPTLNIPNFQTGYSIVAWVKPTAAPPPGNPDEYYGEIVSKGAAGFEIRIGSNLNVEACHASSSGVVCTTSGYLSLNAWALVAVTWDAASGTWQIYYDGAPSGSPSTVAGLQAAPTDGDIMIGRDSSFDRWHFPGVIDDVRIYDYALTATNIQEIYISEAPAPALVTTLGGYGTGDGQFYGPEDITIDSSGNIYVADSVNYRIQWFDSSRTFRGWFGRDNGGVATWHGPGSGKTPTQASGDGLFHSPDSIAVDSSGNAYVTEVDWDIIQKFVLDTGTYLGWWGRDDQGNSGWHSPGLGRTGAEGTGNGEFANPTDSVVDSSGYVYVVDGANSRIQKFTSSGGFLAIWGGFGHGDGQFAQPRGIAIDSSGNFYVADFGNNRIWKLDSSGTFLGWWGRDDLGGKGWHPVGSGRTALVSGYDGDGEFHGPWGIVADSSGYIYVTEREGQRFQKFTSSGVFVSKSAVNLLTSPEGIAVDSSGFIYVADWGGNRIQIFR